jgi:hypothetical protein
MNQEFMNNINQSVLLNTIHTHLLMPLYSFIEEYDLMKSNKKWVLLGLGSFLCISMISVITYYYYVFFSIFVGIKLMLYFIDSYEQMENIEENSPIEIIEYSLIIIFMNFIYPITYLPYLWVIGYILMIIVGIGGLFSQSYRQQIILFIRNIIKGKDGQTNEFKSILQSLLKIINSINNSIFNITCNTTELYTKLNMIHTFAEGIATLSEVPNSEEDDISNSEQEIIENDIGDIGNSDNFVQLDDNDDFEDF